MLEYVDRRGTGSEKWDGQEKTFGENGLLGMWVADMDFKTAPCVRQALARLVDEGVFDTPMPTLSNEIGELTHTSTVLHRDIDTNHHVNNGQYVTIAMEYLPDDFLIHQMRAEYKKQAFLDDVLYPCVVSVESGYVVSLRDEEGRPYVYVEFLQ